MAVARHILITPRRNLNFFGRLRFMDPKWSEYSKMKVPSIRKKVEVDTITYKNMHGKSVTHKTAWHDSSPSDNPRATVVTVHGVPGSHDDFKFIFHELRAKNIRCIGLNLPGFGHTEMTPDLSCWNEDRDAYISAIVDKLDLRNIVWVGHSRGNENAFRGCVNHAARSLGTVQMNHYGLRIHPGASPQFVLTFGRLCDEGNALTRAFGAPFMWLFYRYIIGFPLSAKDSLFNARVMDTISIEKMWPFVDQFNAHRHLRGFFIQGGQDRFNCPKIADEFMDALVDSDRIEVHDHDKHEQLAMDFIRERFRAGHRVASVRYRQTGHFSQRHHARTVATAIDEIVANSQKYAQ